MRLTHEPLARIHIETWSHALTLMKWLINWLTDQKRAENHSDNPSFISLLQFPLMIFYQFIYPFFKGSGHKPDIVIFYLRVIHN